MKAIFKFNCEKMIAIFKLTKMKAFIVPLDLNQAKL